MIRPAKMKNGSASRMVAQCGKQHAETDRHAQQDRPKEQHDHAGQRRSGIVGEGRGAGFDNHQHGAEADRHAGAHHYAPRVADHQAFQREQRDQHKAESYRQRDPADADL
jgi:hypothetical protein